MKTKKKEIDSLKKQFEAVANKYASLFCAKQGMDFGGWELFCIFVYGKNNRNL